MKLTDIAMRLALEAHSGVLNKHNGEPYILHVHRVASNFDPATQPIEYASAWLHDTVEDTDLTLKDISLALWDSEDASYDGSRIEAVLSVVDLLTKVKGESNEDYYWKIKRNPFATRVKIADIHDNFGRNYLIEDEETKLRMMGKYSLGISILARQT